MQLPVKPKLGDTASKAICSYVAAFDVYATKVRKRLGVDVYFTEGIPPDALGQIMATHELWDASDGKIENCVRRVATLHFKANKHEAKDG